MQLDVRNIDAERFSIGANLKFNSLLTEGLQFCFLLSLHICLSPYSSGWIVPSFLTYRLLPGAGKQMGLPDELEEIESREEEFPMTRGFINLLCKLVESGASLAV